MLGKRRKADGGVVAYHSFSRSVGLRSFEYIFQCVREVCCNCGRGIRSSAYCFVVVTFEVANSCVVWYNFCRVRYQAGTTHRLTLVRRRRLGKLLDLPLSTSHFCCQNVNNTFSQHYHVTRYDFKALGTYIRSSESTCGATSAGFEYNHVTFKMDRPKAYRAIISLMM